MKIDFGRVGDLWVAAGPGLWRVSTAFRLRPDLVITARHSLPEPADTKQKLDGSVFFRVGDRSVERKLRLVEWSSEAHDIALLSLQPQADGARDETGLEPVWVSYPRSTPEPARTCGFPDATTERRGAVVVRESKGFEGALDPLGGLRPTSTRQRDRLIVDVTRPVLHKPELLKGVSGAAVTVDRGLVGFVVNAIDGMSSIEAVPADELLKDDEFRELMGGGDRLAVDGDVFLTHERSVKRFKMRTRAIAALSLLSLAAAALGLGIAGATEVAAATGTLSGVAALGAQWYENQRLRSDRRVALLGQGPDRRQSAEETTEEALMLVAAAPLAAPQNAGWVLSAFSSSAHALRHATTWLAACAVSTVVSLGSLIGVEVGNFERPPLNGDVEECSKLCEQSGRCNPEMCAVPALADTRSISSASLVREEGLPDAGPPATLAAIGSASPPSEFISIGQTSLGKGLLKLVGSSTQSDSLGTSRIDATPPHVSGTFVTTSFAVSGSTGADSMVRMAWRAFPKRAPISAKDQTDLKTSFQNMSMLVQAGVEACYQKGPDPASMPQLRATSLTVRVGGGVAMRVGSPAAVVRSVADCLVGVLRDKDVPELDSFEYTFSLSTGQSPKQSSGSVPATSAVPAAPDSSAAPAASTPEPRKAASKK